MILSKIGLNWPKSFKIDEVSSPEGFHDVKGKTEEVKSEVSHESIGCEKICDTIALDVPYHQVLTDLDVAGDKIFKIEMNMNAKTSSNEALEVASDPSVISEDEVLVKRKYTKPKNLSRWNRSDDSVAFQILDEYLKVQSMTLQIFFTYHLQDYDEILAQISRNLNWLRTIDALYHRLFNTFKKAQKFSVRNLKKLRRLVKRKKSLKSSEVEEIRVHYPGMTFAQVQAAINGLNVHVI